jgi:hypothetical protein
LSLSIPLRKADLLESLSDGDDDSARSERLLLGLLSRESEDVEVTETLDDSLLIEAVAVASVGKGGARGAPVL